MRYAVRSTNNGRRLTEIVLDLRPKPLVARNKNKKSRKFFILFSTSTYDEYVAYIFVDFRLKRAGRANSRGATFRLRRKVAKFEIQISKAQN